MHRSCDSRFQVLENFRIFSHACFGQNSISLDPKKIRSLDPTFWNPRGTHPPEKVECPPRVYRPTKGPFTNTCKGGLMQKIFIAKIFRPPPLQTEKKIRAPFLPWKLRVNAVEKHINSIFNGKSVVIIFSGPLPYKGSKFLRVPLFASGPLTSVCAGADPASGKGGPNCWPITGVPWGWPPGGGPGGRAPMRREILNFWTQFARFGAYTFCQHRIENLLIYFQ